MNASTFCERLKSARKELGINQAQAAELFGVKRETWSRYECGLLSPGMEVLTAIAAKGADINYILTGEKVSNSLAPDESVLLEHYRDSPKELKKAALRVLLGGGDQEKTTAKFVAGGNIGHAVDASNGRNMSIRTGT